MKNPLNNKSKDNLKSQLCNNNKKQEDAIIQNNNIETEDSNIIINDDQFEQIETFSENNEIEDNHNDKYNEIEYINKDFNNLVLNKNVSEEEELRVEFLKNYTKIHAGKDKKFLERMKFDIDNRKIKETKMDEFIDMTKLKMNEEERVKIFNRLIEDTNRRIEAKEKIKLYNENNEIKTLKSDNINNSNKKYNKDKWKDIYEKRFVAYLDNKNKRLKKKIIEKEYNDKKKEDDIINFNKHKKKPEQMIRKHCIKMHNEYILKKVKSINKEKDMEILKNDRYSSTNNKKENILKRNKSTGNNKRKSNNNKYYQNKDSYFMKGLNNKWLNKKENNFIDKCFTPPSSLKKRIKYQKIPNDAFLVDKYPQFEIGSISEALFEAFFSNKKK